MECKCIIVSAFEPETGGINRYIMECKCKLCQHRQRLPQRINRYIMECKLLRLAEQNVTGSELIDTLWNVNEF